jgi:hypothetical protein
MAGGERVMCDAALDGDLRRKNDVAGAVGIERLYIHFHAHVRVGGDGAGLRIHAFAWQTLR